MKLIILLGMMCFYNSLMIRSIVSYWFVVDQSIGLGQTSKCCALFESVGESIVRKKKLCNHLHIKRKRAYYIHVWVYTIDLVFLLCDIIWSENIKCTINWNFSFLLVSFVTSFHWFNNEEGQNLMGVKDSWSWVLFKTQVNIFIEPHSTKNTMTSFWDNPSIHSIEQS